MTGRVQEGHLGLAARCGEPGAQGWCGLSPPAAALTALPRASRSLQLAF